MTQEVQSPALKKPAPPKQSFGAFLFEVFCAAIFLGMIGLVLYNAILRYVFHDSFAPSEEWARFLFIYITFFGAIEAFYRKKHIAVDLFVGLTSGCVRKTIDIIAAILTLGALTLLLIGGIDLVQQTIDTNSVATGVNMALVNGTLPIMAAAAIIMILIDLFKIIRKPSGEFKKSAADPAVVGKE